MYWDEKLTQYKGEIRITRSARSVPISVTSSHCH